MKPTKTKPAEARASNSSRRKKHSGKTRPRTPESPIRILVPVDFSRPSLYALRLAADFARQYGGRITLLHVFEPPKLPQVSTYLSNVKMGIIMAQLATRLTELGRKHIDTAHLETARVESGESFEEIIATARALHADVIIIATHGYTGLKRVLLGSTTERVIRYAPCAVLTVREDQRRTWPTGVGYPSTHKRAG